MKRVIFSVAVLLLVVLCGFSPVSGATISELLSLPIGTSATIGEAIILSSADLEPDSLYKSFQLRDNTGAITVYGTNAQIDDVLASYALGDVIEIGGIIDRRQGTLVFGSVGGFAVTGRTSTAPMFSGALSASAADLDGAAAEIIESQLVCLHNVQFADTGLFTAGGDYAILGGPAVVRIAFDGLGLAGQPIPTGPVDITGIVLQYDPSNPSGVGTGYRLVPRNPADIVYVPEPATLVLLGLGGILLRKTIRK